MRAEETNNLTGDNHKLISLAQFFKYFGYYISYNLHDMMLNGGLKKKPNYGCYEFSGKLK